MTPLQYFKLLFDDEVVLNIVKQTNLYSNRQTGISVNTNKSEIEQFWGILLYTSIAHMPSYEDYWAQGTRYSKIADVMPLKRFEKLR